MVFRISRVLWCVGLIVGMQMAASSLQAAARPSPATTLLIVPARPRIIQLAMDLADMRPVVVLSCRGDARAVDPLLFVWTKGTWQYVSPDDFREHRFVAEWPRQAIVIGDDHALPAMLEDDSSWGADVMRLKTMVLADLINGMDPIFHFTGREWKWLARRYGLTLKDINEPRRNFNPYDTPRSKLPLVTKDFKQQKNDVPPAVLVESSVEKPAPAEAILPPQAGGVKPVAIPADKDPSLK